MPDQRARLLQAALEENPADSNWTTHYLKYYEFFTTQFAQARRAATKERRYRPDMVMISSSPDPDRQPLPPHLQEHHPSLFAPPPQQQQQQPCPMVDGDLKNVWLLLYQRISGQSAIVDNNMDLLTSKAGALAEVKEAIRAGDILAIYGVVTLSFLDVYEGPFIDCQWHMLGAKALLQLHCHDLASLNALCAELAGLREAISLLSWYDTMGFYFEQDRRNALVFPDWVREAMHDDFFKLVSCPRDTYMVYAAVVKARTAHRGNREDGDATPSPPILTSAEAGGPAESSTATGAIVAGPKVQQQQQRDMKLTMLGIQQILQTSHSQHGRDYLDQTSIVKDCFRYAAALIAIETAYTTGDGSSAPIDSETAATLGALADRVCDKVLAGVPVNSGRYRHLAAQVTILGHHARTQRHRDAVGAYWTRCDTLARPIYPNGRVISSVEEHWTRVLGASKPS